MVEASPPMPRKDAYQKRELLRRIRVRQAAERDRRLRRDEQRADDADKRALDESDGNQGR